MRIETIERTSFDSFLTSLQSRSQGSFKAQEEAVAQIIADIRTQGDAALTALTKQFDRADLTPEELLVTDEEINEAYALCDPSFPPLVRRAADRIRAFHEHQKENSWMMTEENGSILGQRVIPLSIAGVYVPGGRASYPSTVLMNVIPAKVAGVPQVIVCTPCGADKKVPAETLIAANEAGADRIYKVGGAQAIAAMAYGTETIPRVDKITGPGNIYVALAKKAVFGQTGIDSVAGPSEILVLADETADPAYAAADLLSQAEHDPLASPILVTTSTALAEAVLAKIEEMVPVLERRDVIRASLDTYGRILVAPTMDEAIDAVNAIASEHLEILTADPFTILPKIRNAGAIFLGPYSSEPLGDYFAGPNHVLPTNGTARFFSALSVHDFVKKSSVIAFSREGLFALGEDIMAFAKAEGLTAHANSIAVRMAKEGEKSNA